MKSYEAIQVAIAGKTSEHAKRLHKSTTLLHKWQEPSSDYTDSGAYNPLDRIETIIETALALGNDKGAYEPIYYLAERFGLITIHMPDSPEDRRTLHEELLKTIEEFGHLAKEVGEALNDNIITVNEVRRVQTEAWHLIRQVALFNECVQQAARGGLR